MDLHFAFMFASPLSLTTTTEVKFIPQLNFEKDIKIIKERITDSKLPIKY